MDFKFIHGFFGSRYGMLYDHYVNDVQGPNLKPYSYSYNGSIYFSELKVTTFNQLISLSREIPDKLILLHSVLLSERNEVMFFDDNNLDINVVNDIRNNPDKFFMFEIIIVQN